MEKHGKSFSELLAGLVMNPWRSEPSNVSRDFWMPDQSCRVCYECDAQFTVINRKHHCRKCGRVFCAKCTSNTVPSSYCDEKIVREEGGRVRVCNFCFNGVEKDGAAVNNGSLEPTPVLSPSLSTTSLVSTKSNSTGNSSTTTPGSASYSTGAYQHASYGSGRSLQMEPHPEKQDMLISNMDSVTDIGDSSPFEFCINRSDDDDDEYGALRSDPEAQHFQHSNEYYGPDEFGEVNLGYRSTKVHPAEENADYKDVCSLVSDNTEFHASVSADKLSEGSGHENNYECAASSAIYGIEGSDTEPVDFENNGLLWLPPDPEDEEDEREAAVCDDDDDEDTTGEWGYLRSSNSFGSSEYRSRDRLNEEHKKAMKNVVDGHFRALVAQLLQVENLPMGEEDNKESWLEIITSLSWEAASLLRPDTSKGGGMDPGGYVKVKCMACGHRSQSMVVRGVVCKKNVANRRMSSKIEKPRLLILGGALEYQRVTNLLSSFDTLLQQEMDHLKMAVAKIAAHHPNVLLVEKSVSRFAQEYLLEKNISLVLNIKKPLLDRIARCTGAQIVPSIDHLSSQKLGYCDLFHVEKYIEEHGSAGQGGKKLIKTLMFFEGCPKPLGCTILLKGASVDELKKVKHVVQYAVFAAYHLALETSFLADEGASLPELPLKSPIAVALPDKPSSIDRSISTIPGFSLPAAGKPQVSANIQRLIASDPNLITRNSGDREVAVLPYSSEGHHSELSASVDMNGLPMEDRQAEYVAEQQSMVLFTSPSLPGYSPSCTRKENNKVGFVQHAEAELCRKNDKTTEDTLGVSDRGDVMIKDAEIYSKQIIERQPGISEAGISHLDNGERDERVLAKEEFPPSPSDHQSILVSLSSRCVWKGTICERAHLLRIKYYGSFDMPLGRYLRDQLFDQSYRCGSCEMPSEAHVHCYTHRQGSLTISVRKLSEFHLTGERDGKIWMWHRCLRCPRVNGFPPPTRRVVMSDAAWGLSFGKFLELSFSNNAAASRVASCGHSLHRDCLRFYGFGKMIACFRYASINLHSVYLPPPKLDFKYDLQDWIKREADEVADNGKRLFSEIRNKLHKIVEKKLHIASLNGGQEVPELRSDIVKLEDTLRKEELEFQESLLKVVNKEARKGQPAIDILDINKLRRQLLFKSYLWDRCLISAAGSDKISHEMISGITATDKEKLNPTEKLDLNVAPKPVRSFTSLDRLPSDLKNDETLKGSVNVSDHQEGSLDHLNQTNVRKTHVEQVPFRKKNRTPLSTSISASDQLDPLETGFTLRKVLSDGQFPNMANLSDTLDAKWTGENGPALAEVSLSNSSASVEATTAVSVSGVSQSGADVTQSKHRDGLPKLDVLCEYCPVYVSLFRELDRQVGARLLLPPGINETIIPIYDDEATSIISYALVSEDYDRQISEEREKVRNHGDSSLPLLDDTSAEPLKSSGTTEDSTLSIYNSRSSQNSDPLAYTKAVHVRVSFGDNGPLGKVKYTVTSYYAERFDSLRRMCCPSQLDFVRSLSRCKRWGAQGGKSNVFFAKSLDDRFIIKQVTKTELDSFMQFAPEYFKYLSESISTGSPTCLAKILGIYQVITKNLKTGKESKMDVLVMENLLFGRNVTKLYDLKGSARSRYNSDSTGKNKVLLDQNLIEAMPTSPIFVGNKAKRLLERAVWNDTAFLASIDVMDYSLLVGIDEEKHELVLGIIDFMRQYTWDKHLETWVKASGILGGPKDAAPTVISPKQYKKRFRKAMSTYFLVVPDQWSPPSIIPSRSQSDFCEDNQQNAFVES